jgi:hypothetical protein
MNLGKVGEPYVIVTYDEREKENWYISGEPL